MFVRLILTLEGGEAEFGNDARAVKMALASYLRAAAARIEDLNDDNAMGNIIDDATGDLLGRVNLAIVGGGGGGGDVGPWLL
jgi:hypothetical protein